MKTVWTPWRMELILGKKEKGCIFCKRIRRKKDREDLILHRGRWSFVMLNKYPYNNGHLMVVPKRHIARLEETRKEEAAELFSLMADACRTLQKALRSEGLNIGVNLGKAAGASIEDHLHFHLVPRWTGDTNFWPVIAKTKAMPEHLLNTYDRLKKIWRPS